MNLDRFVDALKQRKRSPKTIHAYLDSVWAFFQWYDSHDPAKVVREDGDRYIQHLQERDLMPRTIRTNIAALRSFYKIEIYERRLTINPFAEIALPKLDKHLTTLLTLKEIKAMLDAPANTYRHRIERLILCLFWSTGARRGGLADAQVDQYDRVNSTLKLREKGDKDRYVMLTPRAQALLEVYLTTDRKSKTTFLLVDEEGEQFGGHRVYESLRNLAKRSGVTKKIYCHLLRHQFATDMLDGGCDLKSLQEMMGHESLATTSGYLHSSVKRLKEQHAMAHPDSKAVLEKSKGE